MDGRQSEIFGRGPELEAIDRLLDYDGPGAAGVALDGQAGIGKTTVWLVGVEEARRRGLTVLIARPVDADPSPSLTCAPASASTFPIGTTTVTCTATDAAGNSASAHFDVHVRGAGEQLVRLIDKTLLYLDLPSLRAALGAQLQVVAEALVTRRPKAACLALDVYIAAVKIAPSRAFTPAEKAELVADAKRIKAVIGCR